MRAKQFFYVCAGLLMLATAYQLGVRRAEAQMGGDFAGIAQVGTSVVAVTTSGDLYARQGGPVCSNDSMGGPYGFTWSVNCDWTYMGNVLSGGPIAVDPATMGNMKAKYKDEN